MKHLYWTTAPETYDSMTTRRTGEKWREKVSRGWVMWQQVEIKDGNVGDQLANYARGSRGVMSDEDMQRYREAKL